MGNVGIRIDCSEYDIQFKSNKVGVVKKNYLLAREKIIQKYDSIGYLIEYTEITKGILTRWLTVNAFDGTAKFNHYYDYSNNYKDVKCTWCFKDKLNTKNCDTELIWYLHFDDYRNLHSEMKFRVDANGALVFEEGFKWYYEYY